MKKAPSPLVSLLPIVVLVILLFATISVFGSDALNGGSQVSLLTTTAICILIGMAFYKIPWKDYELANHEQRGRSDNSHHHLTDYRRIKRYLDD